MGAEARTEVPPSGSGTIQIHTAFMARHTRLVTILNLCDPRERGERGMTTYPFSVTGCASIKHHMKPHHISVILQNAFHVHVHMHMHALAHTYRYMHAITQTHTLYTHMHAFTQTHTHIIYTLAHNHRHTHTLYTHNHTLYTHMHAIT